MRPIDVDCLSMEFKEKCVNECACCDFAILDQNRCFSECGLIKNAPTIDISQMNPRVVSFDEISSFEVLWLEVLDVRTEEGLAPWIKTKSGRWYSPLMCSELEPDMNLATREEYGKYCRCWTAKPNDELMAKTPWE